MLAKDKFDFENLSVSLPCKVDNGHLPSYEWYKLADRILACGVCDSGPIGIQMCINDSTLYLLDATSMKLE